MLTKAEVQQVLVAATKLVRSSPTTRRMTLGKAIWNTGNLGLSKELQITLDRALNHLIEYDFYDLDDHEVIKIVETKFTKQENNHECI